MRKLRVLVADNDSLSRNLLKNSLAYWGCEVTTSADGAGACEELYAGVDLCILNWEMPKMSGLDLCQWIRSAGLSTEPYVILLTPSNERENIRAGYIAGANDFLTTPFRLQELRSRVSRLAQKVLQKQSLKMEVSRMDPLECYRLDLSFRSHAH